MIGQHSFDPAEEHSEERFFFHGPKDLDPASDRHHLPSLVDELGKVPLFALPLRWGSNTSSQGRDRVCLTSIAVRALHNSDGSIDGGHKAQRSTVGVTSRQCNVVAVGHCKTSPREGWAGMGVRQGRDGSAHCQKQRQAMLVLGRRSPGACKRSTCRFARLRSLCATGRVCCWSDAAA